MKTVFLVLVLAVLMAGALHVVPELIRSGDVVSDDLHRSTMDALPAFPVRTLPVEFERSAEVEYRVIEGDSLGRIASFFLVDIEAIIELNGITNPDVIAAGQRLRVPAR